MKSQGSVITADKSTVIKRCNESISEFSAKIYEQLYKTEGNIFYSPLSIATCLQMVYHGSKGSTKQQCAEVMGILGIDDADILSFYNKLIGTLNKVEDTETLLSLANKVWIKDNYKVLDDYKSMLQKQLKADVARNSFKNPKAAADEVNEWVKGETKGMITDLIEPSMIDPELTRLILCNAVYFKGLWQFPFDSTDLETFHLNAKETKKVQMMKHSGSKSMLYGENDVARFVSLRYKGNKNISMMIILPQVPYQLNSVEEEIIKPGKIDEWFKSMSRRDVDLQLPKFKFEQDYDLKALLMKMGITDMFVEGLADFSGINGEPKDLFISDAVHKAVIAVDEKGTEAAAATGMVMKTRMCAFRPQPPVVFHADQPFQFLIFNENKVLFVGRLSVPKE